MVTDVASPTPTSDVEFAAKLATLTLKIGWKTRLGKNHLIKTFGRQHKVSNYVKKTRGN